MVIAADRRQGRVVKQYVSGLLHLASPLAKLIAKETQETITLTNGIVIEIHTANFKTLRGYTVIGAVCDEAAYWPTDDSANPDTEILAALRPAMATVPDALLVVISSPYARRGELWKTYRAAFGQDRDDVLVAQADTRTMNPTVPIEEIERAYADDPTRAAAEYGGEFRRDVETFITVEVLEAAICPGRHELPPLSGVAYEAFVDPSGGSNDSMTLAVAHANGDRFVLDVVQEVRPPFSPEQVVTDFVALLQTYRVDRVTGDRYAGEWPREQFRKHGVTYQPSAYAKSDIYRELLPLLGSGRIELLDLPRVKAQLAALERRVGRTGRDAIAEPPGSHDDVANVCADALTVVARQAAFDPDLFLKILQVGGNSRTEFGFNTVL
jgi:hypothetical protein